MVLAEGQATSLLLPSCTNTFPGLAPRPYPRPCPQGAASLEGEKDPDAGKLISYDSPTSAPDRPRYACGAAHRKGQAANSPSGTHLPPPETEPALGATTARSTPKKELPSAGVQRGLGSPGPSPELYSQHTKAQEVHRPAQGHTGLAPRCPRTYAQLSSRQHKGQETQTEGTAAPG